MRAGRLRHQILLKRNTGEQGSKGQLLNNYAIIQTIKANVQVLSGSELIKAGVSSNTEFCSILIRRSNKVQHKDIIEWRGNDYTITSIKPDDKNRQMVITVARDI